MGAATASEIESSVVYTAPRAGASTPFLRQRATNPSNQVDGPSMLSRFDDFPIHQTPQPIAIPASSDRNVYDRYWLNGYQDDGAFYFAIGTAIYPHLGILDCGFSIVHDGEQHAFHASRRAPRDPSETEIGPFHLEVIEPMRRLRLRLDENETGIACDLLFTAKSACVEEGRQTRMVGTRTVMDATRFAQFGSWEGEISYAGKTLSVTRDRVPGTKDRSWGIRPVGAPDPGPAPANSVPQVFFLWAPIHWQDHCTHFGVFEDAAGQQWHSNANVVPVYEDPAAIPGIEDPALEVMVDCEHRIEYIPGTRRAAKAEITLVGANGRRLEIELEPLLCFRMKGIGYTHPEWGHGMWKGELAMAGEAFRVDEVDPMALENQHIQQVVRARCEGREGIGVLEQICFGPHARYGFREFLDPAR